MNKISKRLIMVMMAGCFVSGLLLCFGDTTVQGNGIGEVVSENEIEKEIEIVIPSKYSLVDEGYGAPVKSQYEGTCWAVAASNSMESSYKRRYGENIEIDPIEIVDMVYVDDAVEGCKLEPWNDKYDYGGETLQVIMYVSGGIGDYYLSEAEWYDPTNLDDIKTGILTKGAMCIDINDAWNSRYGMIEGYKTLNNPVADYDHSVTLVGWDDDFPKEYFRLQPSKDGAWLAQNTRGDKWGNDGYFWISYETPLDECSVLELSDDFTDVLFYDMGHYNTLETSEAMETITLANVFHKPGTLKKVGTYTEIPDQKVVIDIYDASFEKVLYTQKTTFTHAGYHTVELSTPMELDDYAIAITYYGNAPVEGMTWVDDTWGISFLASSNPGESFVFIDDEWIDMTDERVMTMLGIDYEPNNCCIKAIY